MTARCTRCNRRLTAPSETGLGPKCAQAVLGRKPRKVKREDRRGRDERTADLFGELAA